MTVFGNKDGIWTDEGAAQLNFSVLTTSLSKMVVRSISLTNHLKPFVKQFVTAIREIHPSALLFLEAIPGGAHPHWSADDAPQAVNASHWIINP